MNSLLFGETAMFDGRTVHVNNLAACEVKFTRWPNGHITYEMIDRRNPVNRNTIKRWLGFVEKHFDLAEGKISEAA